MAERKDPIVISDDYVNRHDRQLRERFSDDVDVAHTQIEQKLNLAGVNAVDSAMLKGVIMTAYVMCEDRASAPQRSLLSVYETKNCRSYVFNVAICASEIITADQLWSLWSCFPALIERIILYPKATDEAVSTIMSVSVCKTKHTPAEGFVLQQTLIQESVFDKENYNMLSRDVSSGREGRPHMRSLIGGRPLAQETNLVSSEQKEGEASGNNTNNIKKTRAPWSIIRDKKDCDIVETIVYQCKDMAVSKGDDFWNNIHVEDEPVNYRYRILLHWDIKSSCALDARALAVIQQISLPYLENIRVHTEVKVNEGVPAGQSDGDNAKSFSTNIRVTFVVSKTNNPLIRHRHVRALNMSENMSKTNRDHASITVAGPNNVSTTDTSSVDPIRIAMKNSQSRKLATKRKRDRTESHASHPNPINGNDDGDDSDDGAFGERFGPTIKRRRTERSNSVIGSFVQMAKTVSPF